MSNAITFSVATSDNVKTEVYLTQDETTPTTIHGVFGTSAHDLVGCSASADGKSVVGKTSIFFVSDPVTIDIAPTRVSIDVMAYGDVGGAVSADDETALISFVKACKLPLLAS